LSSKFPLNSNFKIKSPKFPELPNFIVKKQLSISNFDQISGQMIHKLPRGPRPIIKVSLNSCRKQKPRSQFENITYRMITNGFRVEDGKLCPIKVNEIWAVCWWTPNNYHFLNILRSVNNIPLDQLEWSWLEQTFHNLHRPGIFCEYKKPKMDFHNWTWPDCSWISIYFRGINRQVQFRKSIFCALYSF
jgi:hypothetical protein